MNYQDYLNTEIGVIEISGIGNAITGIRFVDAKGESNPNEVVRLAKHQLQSYFDGNLRTFDIPLSPEGTVFQKRVWEALRNVQFGNTVSYGGLAQAIGQKEAARAVGMANNRNPISIVIPCHRVIGSDGKLVGYGAGTWRKKWLLMHENAM